MTDTLAADCGHTYAPSGILAGYAVTPDGRKLCYSCADNSQRAELRVMHALHAPFGAYLTSDTVEENGRTVRRHVRITTWTGGMLMSVFRALDGGRGFHGADLWDVTAVDVHGNVWRGRNGGPGMYITMRPASMDRYAVGRVLGTDGSAPVEWITLDNDERSLDVSRGTAIAWDLNNPPYRERPHLFELTRAGRIFQAHTIPTA